MRIRGLGISLSAFEAAGWEARSLALAAALFPVAVTNLTIAPFWTSRMALVLIFIPLGLARLIAHAAQRDRVAIAALAFLSSCTVATLIAPVPLWNLRGGFGRESSLVFLVAFFAIWSIGRTISQPGRRLVVVGSMLGLGVTGTVAAWQVFAQPTEGLLATIGTRPSGLLGNPVYFGACVAGGAALMAHALAHERLQVLPGCLALGAMAGLVNLSGSRAALLGALVPIVVACRRADSRRLAGLIAASTVGGILLSAVATFLVDGRGTTDRVFDDGSAWTGGGRLGIWGYAWSAFTERPLFGHGLGQFRPAVQSHFDPDFVSKHLTDTTAAAWPDAHNLFVQYSVVGGIAAVIPLALVIYWAAREARGPCAWAVVPIVVVWLTQPATLATAPLAAAWLGIAMPIQRDNDRSEANPLAAPLLAAVGVLLAATTFGLGAQLERSLQRGDTARFVAWARVAPDDPVLATTASDLLRSDGARSASAAWATRAAQLEPRDAVTVAKSAVRQYDAGDTDRALVSIREALEFDRYNPTALATAAVLAAIAGDEELSRLVDERKLELERAVGPEGPNGTG